MLNLIHLYLIVICISGSLYAQDESSESSNEIDGNDNSDVSDTSMPNDLDENNCWMDLDADSHFKVMDELDNKYENARKAYHDAVAKKLDEKLLAAILENQGAAYRATHNKRGDATLIPAGLNLGGYTMMKLKETVLFFHRVKLRNDTIFRINSLQADLMNMSLAVDLSLNDLHMVGAYERCITYHDSSVLYHAPAFGEIELLLKNVGYKMDGRLRVINNRYVIETIDSDYIIEDDILMTYLHYNTTTVQVRKTDLADFLDRMKTDFDLWLKDYFNDYFMYITLEPMSQDYEAYDKSRTMALNEYSDFAIQKLKQRLAEIGAINVKAPNFTLFSVPNVQIKMTEGVVRGLDSMYRRSVATGRRTGKVRHVDVIIGFSNLKVEYKFDADLPVGVPAVVGHFFLSADELIAHLEISLVKEPESYDVRLDFVQQIKPESLTVEGPASRLIASYKDLLECQILSLMTSSLLTDIRMLGTLPRCHPLLHGYDDPQVFSNELDHHDDQPDYVLYKNDSVEIEVPDPKDPERTKRVELKRQETFSIKKLNK